MTEPTLPMSPAQQGMYFDSQLRQSADYHIAIELYTERLSRSRLTQAVSAVVAEQPALRASVARNESGPVYMIAESVETPVRHHDLTGAEENLDKIFHTARHAPFQLNTAPLFRVVAARLPDGDRLLVVYHHLIADGQSVSILTDRIIDLARGTREITASRTDQGLFTYQNGQLSRPSPETLARRESFWSENLPRHRIPQLDHWLLASPHEDAAREFRLTVPRDAAEAVHETAQEAEVSEFTVYLAAFGALLTHPLRPAAGHPRGGHESSAFPHEGEHVVLPDPLLGLGLRQPVARVLLRSRNPARPDHPAAGPDRNSVSGVAPSGQREHGGSSHVPRIPRAGLHRPRGGHPTGQGQQEFRNSNRLHTSGTEPRHQGSTVMDSTFWNLRHSETGRQLIMFPFLGGFGASYNRLISDLDGGWEVWTANPPGHGPSPVPPLTDLASLRTHYLDALRDILKPDAVFCGHSMGSVVAYHLLACMHRLPAFADRMPSDLVLSGSCAPHHLPMAGKADLADTDLVLHLASFGAIPDEVVKDKSLMDLFVPAFRADYKVLEEMRTTPTENLPIRARLVFGGRDPQIPEDTPAAWQKYFASPVKTHVLEREEHMFVLHTTEALNQILNRI